MSLLTQAPSPPTLLRKRTSSFSCPTLPQPSPNPRPAKVARTMGSLHRSETLLAIPTSSASNANAVASSSSTMADKPKRPPSLAAIRDREKKRKTAMWESMSPMDPTRFAARPPLPVIGTGYIVPQQIVGLVPRKAKAAPIATPVLPKPRLSSPLSDQRVELPPRPVFAKKGRRVPDLYQTALKTCLRRGSPEGQKIVNMGPRLALGIINATEELQRIVGNMQEREREREDVIMSDFTTPNTASTTTITTTSYHGSPAPPVLSNSWVMVPDNDWEMVTVDCSA